ncbi:MAG TPA: hypothetical protein VLG13_00760 [Patescibacteria group bacterium]|nr:hypothetical protein [Patescibacteria group bacterium]
MIKPMEELHTDQAVLAGASEHVAAELSLLDRFSDEVVTFRGVTAPLGTLVNLCPIPKDQMQPEKVEEYASKILQESGFDMTRLEAAVTTETAKKK